MNNKKKSSDKDTHNLRQLLRENILSTSSNNKIQHSKNKYVNTNPNIAKRNQKLFSFSMLKYKPKRLINFKGINIPLPALGKASLDYSKTFGPDNISEIQKKQNKHIFNSKTIIKKNKNKIENLIKDDNLIEFKNKYILKYAQYSDDFSKFYHNKELISDARKRDFEDLYDRIFKYLESQSQLLLNDIDHIIKENNDNDISVSPYTKTMQESSPKNDYFNKNENNLNNKKRILALCSDYNYYIIRFINILFKEIKEYKNEILKLLKKNHEYELKINTTTKELEDLKLYINKYNISKKIFLEKEKENSIKKIKDKYIHKENEYLVSMHKLQEEIHSLMKLLDKNKNYYDKYKNAEKEIDDNKKNNDIMRLKFNKEMQDKNLQIAIEKDKREELLSQLGELNDTIKELKEQKDEQKRQEIEVTAQILKMKIIIEAKNENIMMMNEELEHYMREYNKEKYNHQNTLAALRSLENRIYNEEKEKRNKKEDINSEGSSNIIIDGDNKDANNNMELNL